LSGTQASNLRAAHLPFVEDGHDLLQWRDDVLASVCFSRRPVADGVAPTVQVPMAALNADGAFGSAFEIWCADGSIRYGQRDALRFWHNDEILFGLIQLAEAEFDTDAGKTPLQQATEHAYREIFKLTDTLEFGSILRFWNYFADINGESHGSERYRQFNVGRQDGFLSGGRTLVGGVPAACALGFAEGPLTVYFFAARGVTPLAIENPRQISAYHYPADYGKRSPTFSRASVAHLDGKDLLFLSGTASIVGHQTLHLGDVVAQTRETVANIQATVTEANRVVPQAGFSIGELCYKVYVRHAKDVSAIDAELRSSLGQSARLTYLHADICRHDLLMEIEATAGHPMEQLPA
jgi:chorismate lyase / 3-hydroxybenzoate synthase